MYCVEESTRVIAETGIRMRTESEDRRAHLEECTLLSIHVRRSIAVLARE